MNTEKIAQWLAPVANLGVVAGLALVLMQMNQNEQLLRVQLMNDFFESYVASDTTFAGENLPAIWQKSVEAPQDLSIAEMRALEAQTFSPLSRWINLHRLAEAGMVDEEFLSGQLELDVSYYLGSPYGRAWWEVFSQTFPENYLPADLKSEVDAQLANTTPNLALIQYRDIQQILERRSRAAPNEE